jgi:hypothetical protein
MTDLEHKLEQYRAILQRIIEEQAAYKPMNGAIETVRICDVVHDHYLVMTVGWDGTHRVLDPVIYLRLHNGKVWVEEDGTDANIVEQLLAAGIPMTDIVIGFHHPEEHAYTEFATG